MVKKIVKKLSKFIATIHEKFHKERKRTVGLNAADKKDVVKRIRKLYKNVVIDSINKVRGRN